MRERPVKTMLGLSYLGGVAALGVATCCIMPMSLMLLGIGGSSLAVFGKIAAWSYPVLAVSGLLLLLAWAGAARRGSLARFRWWLTGSTVLSAIAWGQVLSEAGINEYLITLM